jgi:hypothetical protein
MGPNLKFSAYFAGSAFAIATLTGALAGVGFGAILLRAVIGAIVFAGIGYGSYIVISARLPELLSGGAATSSTAQADGYGQNVDIVVDDDGEEDELPAAEEPDAAESDRAAGAEQTAEAGTSQAHGDEDEPGDLEEVAEDVESPAGGGDELVEEVEEVAAAPADSTASAKSESEDVDENSVDALPDIGGFAGDFESEGAEGAEVVEEDDSNGGFGGSSRAQSHGIEQDPEVIAKALQTVIKRDE